MNQTPRRAARTDAESRCAPWLLLLLALLPTRAGASQAGAVGGARQELLERAHGAPDDPLPALLLAELAAREQRPAEERDWLLAARRRSDPHGVLAQWIDARRETLRLSPAGPAAAPSSAERRRATAAHVEALDCLARGRLQRGEAVLREALRLDPSFARPYFDLALLAEGAGDLPLAVTRLEELLVRAPDDALALEAELRLRRLRPLLPLARSEEGAKVLRYALLLERAGALGEEGRFDEALAEVAAADGALPERYEAALARAALLARLGRGAEAADAAARALSLAPTELRDEVRTALGALEPSAAGAPVTPAVGWRGEPLPPGLECGSKRGEYVWRQDGSILVRVEGGRGAGPGGELVASFYVDRDEVSWERFAAASGAGVRSADGAGSPRAGPTHPVVQVSWDEAHAYALQLGKRLPTEAQWELAARGPAGASYPWGSELDSTRLNLCDRACPLELRWKLSELDDGHAWTAPVGSYPAGASACGALDLAGNVREWCEDRLTPGSPARVVRGGGWRSSAEACRTDYRTGLPADARRDDVGFRCVVPALAEEVPVAAGGAR